MVVDGDSRVPEIPFLQTRKSPGELCPFCWSVAGVMDRYVTRPLRRSLAPVSVVTGRSATRPLRILSAGTGLWMYPAANLVSYFLFATLVGASERCNGWVSYLLGTRVWKTDLPEIRIRCWRVVRFFVQEHRRCSPLIPRRQPSVTPGITRVGVGCTQGGTKARPGRNPGVARA